MSEPSRQPTTRDWLLLASGSSYKFTLVGFCLVAVMTILKSSGYSLGQLSWFYLLGSAEVGKVGVSALLERYRIAALGRFRGWLLLAGTGIAAALAGLLLIEPAQDFLPLLAFCLIISIMSVVYGCAMLGLSCILLPYRERGYGGVIQTVAARIGKMLGGALVLWVYHRHGWHAAIAVMLSFTALMLLQLTAYREPDGNAPAAAGFSLLLARIIGFWRQPCCGAGWLLLLFVIGMPYAYTAATFVPKLKDLGFADDVVGQILAVLIPVACILTTPLMGHLSRRCSRLRLIHILLAVQLPVLLSFVWIDQTAALRPWLPPVQIVCLSVGYTLLLPLLLALLMDKSAPATAALDSSLQFSVILAGTYAAGFLSLRLAAHIGYAANYQIAVALAAVSWLMVGLGRAMIERGSQTI